MPRHSPGPTLGLRSMRRLAPFARRPGTEPPRACTVYVPPGGQLLDDQDRPTNTFSGLQIRFDHGAWMHYTGSATQPRGPWASPAQIRTEPSSRAARCGATYLDLGLESTSCPGTRCRSATCRSWTLRPAARHSARRPEPASNSEQHHPGQQIRNPPDSNVLRRSISLHLQRGNNLGERLHRQCFLRRLEMLSPTTSAQGIFDDRNSASPGARLEPWETPSTETIWNSNGNTCTGGGVCVS